MGKKDKQKKQKKKPSKFTPAEKKKMKREKKKIREKLLKKNPELELDHLSLEELQKLSGPNKRRRGRGRQGVDTNYPCPHLNCKVVCNSAKQLEEHANKKHHE